MVAQTIKLPNIKELFEPDEGMVWGDFDQAQADARVVAWEAHDEELQDIFNDPTRDLHIENGIALGVKRQLAKAGVHATNYGVRPKTLGRTLGITTHEADLFIRRWFDIHPGIEDWHERVRDSLESTRTVWNAFGYKRQYFDRPEALFTQALAWIPQSTVAIVTNRAVAELDRTCPSAQFLLQVHDSVIYQWPEAEQDNVLRRVRTALERPVPYEKPLIIPCGAKVSRINWGVAKPLCLDCKGESFYPKPMPEICMDCYPGLREEDYAGAI